MKDKQKAASFILFHYIPVKFLMNPRTSGKNERINEMLSNKVQKFLSLTSYIHGLRNEDHNTISNYLHLSL